MKRIELKWPNRANHFANATVPQSSAICPLNPTTIQLQQQQQQSRDRYN